MLVEGIKMLAEHPMVEPDLARLCLGWFGKEGLKLGAFCYLKTADYLEYLDIADALNLRLMEVVAEPGTALALPTQRVLLDEPAARGT